MIPRIHRILRPSWLMGLIFFMGHCNSSPAGKEKASSPAAPSAAVETQAEASSAVDEKIPVHIIARLEGGKGINVVLDRLLASSFQPMVEAVADENGVIDIRTTIPTPGPYQLRFPHGSMHLILKGGTLRITGSIDRLSAFEVEGDHAEETRALYHLYHIIEQFNHEFRRLQRRSREAGETKDPALVRQILDSLGYVSTGIQYRKNQAMRHFVETHDTMLVMGMAALRIDLDVFFPALARADSVLQARYPTSHLTADLHKKFLAAYPYMPDKPAPPFTLPDLKGQQHSLADWQGQYVLLDFWASWCQPCIRSFPHMKRLYRQFSGRNFQIVGISIDDAPEKAEAAATEHRLPWLILWAGSRSQTTVDYKVEGIPHYVVIDPSGHIASMMLRGQALELYLAEHLTP